MIHFFIVVSVKHEFCPERRVDRDLASHWLRMARELGIGSGIDANAVVDRKMKRGEFLNYLFARYSK